MRTKIATFVIGSMLACSAHAASWYVFHSVGGDRAVYFFDMDTVVKRSGGAIIWIKSVNSEATPDKDGSYATAMKYNIDCNKQTLQPLTMVTYDKNQLLMQTITSPGKPSEPIPGSIGEALFKSVCSKNFPSKQSEDYSAVANNDIYTLTRAYFLNRNDPAPK